MEFIMALWGGRFNQAADSRFTHFNNSLAIDHPKLREHLAYIVTLLKLSKIYEEFIGMVDKIHPKFKDTNNLIIIDQ